MPGPSVWEGDSPSTWRSRVLTATPQPRTAPQKGKSRHITLPTKVCLVKAMVFPVVMYGCESWTMKAER